MLDILKIHVQLSFYQFLGYTHQHHLCSLMNLWYSSTLCLVVQSEHYYLYILLKICIIFLNAWMI